MAARLDDRQPIRVIPLENCAHCGRYRSLVDEPDGTRVCSDCDYERNGGA